MYTEAQIKTIVSAQEKQIANPTRAVVNSESAFAAQTIRQTDAALASDYWSWVCSYSGKNADKFGPVVRANQDKMEAIDKQQTMPSWGYAGT